MSLPHLRSVLRAGHERTTACASVRSNLGRTGLCGSEEPTLARQIQGQPSTVRAFRLAAASMSPARGASSQLDTAVFGMGCFWSPDAVFSKIEGVIRTTVGYTGGTSASPTYNSVCANDGHTEAIKVDFDASTVSYDELISVFLAEHQPTYKSGKPQYKSAIWTQSREQEDLARAALHAYAEQHKQEVATDVAPAQPWYDAEAYHQKYYVRERASTLQA